MALGYSCGQKGFHFAIREFCRRTLCATAVLAMPGHGLNARGTVLAECFGRLQLQFMKGTIPREKSAGDCGRALQLSQMVNESRRVDDVVAMPFDSIGRVAVRIRQAESGSTGDMITGVNA